MAFRRPWLPNSSDVMNVPRKYQESVSTSYQRILLWKVLSKEDLQALPPEFKGDLAALFIAIESGLDWPRQTRLWT